MKSKSLKRAFLILVLFFSLYNLSYSQLRFLVGPTFGFTQPTGDYNGSTTDFYTGTKYGLSSGVNYGAVAKLTLGPINGKLSVSWVSLSNSGNADVNHPTTSTVTVKNSIFTVGIGSEFGFGIPFSSLRPYAGIDLLFSTISGSFQYQSTANVNSDNNSIPSASRTGLGLNLGAEYGVGKSITLDLSFHYNILNLFGKSYQSGGTNRLAAYTSLNDAADPNYSVGDQNHPIGNSRSIALIQIQLGVLFGF
jgi:opacity protein-like surface antigen